MSTTSHFLSEWHTLDKGYEAVARLVAKQRHDSNRNAGTPNGKIGPQSDELTDFLGTYGELAFSWLMNIHPDLSIFPRNGGPDCYSRRRSRIDVKTSDCEDGHLVAKLGTPKDAVDYYVAILVKLPRFRYVGWATSDELIREENIGTLGHGLTYKLPYRDLHPPSDNGNGITLK